MLFRLSFLLLLSQSLLFAQSNWKPAYSPLSTVYSIGFGPADAHPEYPRPQMVREKWMNLNGLWDLQIQNDLTKNFSFTGKILVPFPVESALSGVKETITPFDIMHYRRTFTIPENWKDQRVLLHFGAVDWETQVRVNGKMAGSHYGAYDAFSFDITDQLNETGEQLIELVVKDPTDKAGQPIGKQKLDNKGIWYTPVSGIWQTVWMEPVPQDHIKSILLQPQDNLQQVYIQVETDMERSNDYQLLVRLFHQGIVVSESMGRPQSPHMLSVPNVQLWTPDNPHLYNFEIVLSDANKKIIDKIAGYFGMRKIGLGKDEKGFTRIMLNGKPLFQLGVLDQGYWPEGLYTAPSEAAMKNDIQMLKDMGFNMIRKHVKVEPARWYHLCDKMGMLVWQDMPNALNRTDENKEQFMREMKAMVDGLVNHPSIVVWVPFNEGWGQHDTERYTSELKVWDKTRLVNSASGWTDFGSGDIIDIHAYPGPAAPAPEENRASVLGEFGGLGINVPGHMWAREGWGYQSFNSPEELLVKYENLYRSLRPMIDTLGLSAAIYTQVTDIETENNGLLTYDRKVVKMDPHLMKLAHGGQLPPNPATEARIFTSKTRVALAASLPGAQIEYTLTEIGPTAKWKNYRKPFKIRKSQAFYTRASWPDGKKSRAQQFVFEKVIAIAPITKPESKPGLMLKTYKGAWDSLPDFNQLQQEAEMIAAGFSLSQITLDSDFGLVFSGYLTVPATDTYTFFLESDDGSKLSVAGQSVIVNDGIHGMKEMPGSLALKKGSHTIILEYFQKKGGKGLKLWMEDARGNRIPVPESWLSH